MKRYNATTRRLPAGGGSSIAEPTLALSLLLAEEEFPSKSTVNHAYSGGGKARGHGGSGEIFVGEREE